MPPPAGANAPAPVIGAEDRCRACGAPVRAGAVLVEVAVLADTARALTGLLAALATEGSPAPDGASGGR